MARKRFARKSKRSTKRRGRAKPKKMTKTMVRAVKKIVEKKLDTAIEDKYINDSAYHDHSGDWDTNSRSGLFNVTPTITKGDGKSERTGNSVSLKFLRMYWRLLPAKFHRKVETMDSNPSYTKNPFPRIPSYVARFMKINRDLYSKLSTTELLAILNAKYRVPGQSVQDVLQNVGRKGMVGIQLLGQTILKPRYKTFVSGSTPLASQVTADGTGFDLAPDHEPFVQVLSIPQYTFKEQILSKVKQKIVMQDTDNLPMKYQYFVFVQCGNNYIDATYDIGIDSAPQKLETRNCWVFEDA